MYGASERLIVALQRARASWLLREGSLGDNHAVYGPFAAEWAFLYGYAAFPSLYLYAIDGGEANTWQN